MLRLRLGMLRFGLRMLRFGLRLRMLRGLGLLRLGLLQLLLLPPAAPAAARERVRVLRGQPKVSVLQQHPESRLLRRLLRPRRPRSSLSRATRQSESGPPPGQPPRLRLLSLCGIPAWGSPSSQAPIKLSAPGCPGIHPVLGPTKLPECVIFLPGTLRATVDSTACMDTALCCLHRLPHSRCSINAY
ncbi:unnamed protein product [Pipistrellus nathusii]|uniref:Uncharacterized protein n=1 Tax=Pipistrellus nathusii TaxID=59473 RepID=A0ABN9ZR66_PIPNA